DPYYPGYGDDHDYTVAVTGLSGGSHTICVHGVNVGGGSDSVPICRAVALPSGNPFGVVDTATGSASSVHVDGWMIDPDTAAPIQVQVSVDGHAPTTVSANGNKPGLDPVFPGYGNLHDFSTDIPGTYANGVHQVCVVGLNVGGGVNGPSTCKSLTISGG
ncbi:MAG TPA: hypothetical protein VGF80_03635, partial [Galbitalea sp.]